MENRDFKGIWIPKNIWLNAELSVLDKVLLAEIDSLDNENHCTASNEYFAEFFGVGVATITRSIKKLKELGFIETEMKTSNSGNYRLIKMITGSNQIDETGVIKMSSNYNNDNNIDKVVSKDTTSIPEFSFGFEPPKKPNLYEKCIALIDEKYSHMSNVRKLLIQYLDLRLDISKQENKPFYANQWKGILNDLDNIHKQGFALENIIQQSITRGYKSFYAPAVSNGNNRDTNKMPQKKFDPNVDKLSNKSY